MSIKQRTKSLKSRAHNLADSFIQLKVLNKKEVADSQLISFEEKLRTAEKFPLKPSTIEIFQINIGKLCNQTCAHCHVDAGPDRKEEQMSRENLEICLEIIAQIDTIKTVDITGGAPEMNANFRWFVEQCHQLGKTVMDRCNLTIIEANKKYADLPEFFKANKVHVVSSLPYFAASKTDRQRGSGVFNDSINALKKLNAVGYGVEGSGLVLDLVYNPEGAYLPGSQASLESEFKRQLKRKYDISFNNLFAITNLPISRFLDYLIESGNYTEYMDKLVNAFNPGTVDGLMCRNTISVSWDGYIYDCDFNQMLDLKVATKASQHIKDFDATLLQKRNIVINRHCFGCTAGSGSSCGGSIE